MLKRAKKYLSEFTPTLCENSPTFYDKSALMLPQTEITHMHYHNCYEIGVCTQGNGIFISRDHIEPIRSGDAIFIPPEVNHYSQSLDSCRCQFLYIDLNQLFNIINVTDATILKFIKAGTLLDIPPVIRDERHTVLNSLIKQIITDYIPFFRNGYSSKPEEQITADTDYTNNQMLSYKLLAVRMTELLLLCNQIFVPFNESLIMAAEISPAVEYIALHYSEKIVIEELANLCHISQSTLRRRFINDFNMSPYSYLNSFRCRIGAMLLKYSDFSVAEIAQKTGFTDVSDFYRVFISQNKISPTAYRKKHNAEKD